MYEVKTSQAELTEIISGVEREKHARYDLETMFSELVDGSMRTDFELQFNGHDLIGEDGRSLDEITSKGLEDAKEIAKLVPSLWFDIRRRSFDRQEFLDLVQMARGEGPNTKVVVSDFPAELVGAKKDIGGYNVTRQQTMLRVITRNQYGNLHLYSRTLDGSNRLALEAIYNHLEETAHPGELLPQPINKDISPERQDTLVDELKDVYDHSLSSQYGGRWHAGRRPVDYRNTFDFVCRQKDLIEECVRLQNIGWLNDDFMYNVSAEMNKRFKAEKQGFSAGVILPIETIDLEILHRQIAIAGSQARQTGQSYSACGFTLDPESLGSSQFEQAGYGNKSAKDCEYISKECPLCHAKNVKTRVSKISATTRLVKGSCGCSKQYHMVD